MPTIAELNNGSVQLEREVELRADAVAEGMDTRETVSLNDQRVVHLSTDVNAELQLIIKDSGGGNPTVRQPSRGRIATASDSPPSSSTCITHSSLVLSSTVKGTSMKSCVLCRDYASINPFERTKVNGQFREDKPTVYESVIVKLTCTNKGLSSFKLLFECYYLWCKLLCAYAWLTRYFVCLFVIYILQYSDMSVLPFRFEDIADRRKSANELCNDFPAST
ncbi:unnamed protein product [Trichobilharzia regenti]|nr:unnamed protein product [Trichobilharzia regenti]